MDPWGNFFTYLHRRIELSPPTIKFTTNWSVGVVGFLDTWVYIRDWWIETDLYVKPTDTHQFLHIDSCHPAHCKTAIPYKQVLHLRRICSGEEHLWRRSTDLKNYLPKRGYNEQNLHSEIQRALQTPMELCSQNTSPNDREKSAHTPLMVRYHPALSSLGASTKQYQPIHHASERLKQAFPLPP